MEPAACHQPAGESTASPRWELADIFRRSSSSYREQHPLPASHLKVIRDLVTCRTALCGGHVEKCTDCDFQRNAYNSCRNRHCPKCQTLNKERWLADRKADLLDISYFHNVFTLPHELNPMILCNKEVLLNILFATVSRTLQAFARDPKHRLHGQLGLIAVLHTWDQRLLDHFHLHCLIPAGVLAAEKDRFIKAKPNFLFPVKALSKVFRGKFIAALKKSYAADQLSFPGKTAPLGTQAGFNSLIRKLWDKDWVVYSKQPFAGPRQVLDYLGRYTHRVAISNHRILSVTEDQVSFAYRDRQHDNQSKVMTLEAHEFIRRFLLHVLPKGFVKIRHFGFLANRNRKQNIASCRTLLGDTSKERSKPTEKLSVREFMLKATGLDILKCPQCKTGTLFKSVELQPRPP